MTKVLCELTGCKHNSSCCSSPAGTGHYCKKKEISLVIDSEICTLDCDNFEEDFSKEIECKNCQIEKYGGIKLSPTISFEIKNSKEEI